MSGQPLVFIGWHDARLTRLILEPRGSAIMEFGHLVVLRERTKESHEENFWRARLELSDVTSFRSEDGGFSSDWILDGVMLAHDGRRTVLLEQALAGASISKLELSLDGGSQIFFLAGHAKLFLVEQKGMMRVRERPLIMPSTKH